MFRNNTRFPVGIHPHGVFYEESSEGAHYSIVPTGAGTAPDHNVMPETGADVKPGDEYTYHWAVPERAGPGPSDPDSVAWLYHVHDHEGIDIYAGLIWRHHRHAGWARQYRAIHRLRLTGGHQQDR